MTRDKLRLAVIAAVLAISGSVLTSSCPAQTASVDAGGAQTATQLTAAAGTLYETGRYAEAEPLLRRALAIEEKALGPEHRETAVTLNNLASDLQMQGRALDAEPLFRRALAIDEKTLGPEHPGTATALAALAGDVRNQDRYADAEPLYRRALAIDEKALGPEHPGTAAVLNDLAGDIEDRGHYMEAESLFRRALAIDEKALGPDHRDTVRRLQNLARIIRLEGRSTEAEPLFRRVLAIDGKGLGVDHPDTAQALNELARTIQDQGRYPEAEALLRQALVIDKGAAGSDPRVIASDLNNLAAIVDVQGRYADAETLYRQALEMTERAFGPNHLAAARVIGNLAGDIEAQGRYAEAETLYRRAIVIDDGPEGSAAYRGQDLSNLGLDILDQGRFAEAEKLIREALSIDEKALGLNHPDIATDLDNLAIALSRQGQYAEAEKGLNQAVAIAKTALGPDHPETAKYVENLGVDLEAQGRHSDAARTLRSACNGPAARNWRTGNGLAAQVAETKFEVCSSRLANSIWGWADEGGGKAATDSPDALKREAFGQAQWATLSAAGDAMARSSALIAARQERAGDLAAKYEADLLAHDKLDTDFATAAGGSGADGAARTAALEVARKTVESEIAALTEKLKTRSPHYWDFRSPQPVSGAELQGRQGAATLLRPDEALVLWMIPSGKEPGLVFAVSREGFAWARIGLSGDEIKAKVERLRRQINPRAYARGMAPARGPLLVARDPNWSGFDRETAYALHQALLGDPKIQAVIGPKHTLLIAPSGPMWSLPPGLLVTQPPQGGDNDPAALQATRWLLRDKAVALLPAISSLRTLRQLMVKDRPATPDKLLALADPDFGNRAAATAGAAASPRGMEYYVRGATVVNGALSLPRLPGTRVEALALASALGAPATSVLTDADASKAQLMARNADGRLARVKVLEFATHGLVAGDAGLAQPALALAKGDKPADEWLLASEVTGLKINADWTLLSACNTASPDAPEAQGLSGLSRAFFFAGAVSVLVSHWPVDDHVTSTLIPDTLKRQAKQPDLDRAEALRQASLAILDEPGGRHALPAFWAPFTLIGEPGPLPGR